MSITYLFFSNDLDRILVGLFGILVSIYAFYVEIKKENNPKYKALCDLSENISCTRVLTSEYGKGFGIVSYMVGKEHFLNMRNCTLGLLFYLSQILFTFYPSYWSTQFLLYSSIASMLGSVYLTYILLFVLKDLCIVCVTTYILNGMLMYLNYSQYVHRS